MVAPSIPHFTCAKRAKVLQKRLCINSNAGGQPLIMPTSDRTMRCGCQKTLGANPLALHSDLKGYMGLNLDILLNESVHMMPRPLTVSLLPHQNSPKLLQGRAFHVRAFHHSSAKLSPQHLCHNSRNCKQATQNNQHRAKPTT